MPTSEAEVSEALPDGQRRRLLVALIVGLASSVPSFRAHSDVDVQPPDETAWRSVLETLFPHSKVDEALYSVPASALVTAATAEPARGVLLAGWQALNHSTGSWVTASPAAREQALGEISGTPLFDILRQTMVFTFYNDPKIWAECGYEGDAWRFGGYAGPHLVSVDWLPTST